MNAPINAALLAARASMPAAPQRVQPVVDASAHLLKTGYLHGELYLDLYGTLDADGYDVQTATLTGNTANLADLFGNRQLSDMSDWCNRNLPSARELRLVSQAEDTAHRAMWMLMCDAH